MSTRLDPFHHRLPDVELRVRFLGMQGGEQTGAAGTENENVGREGLHDHALPMLARMSERVRVGSFKPNCSAAARRGRRRSRMHGAARWRNMPSR